MKQAIILSASAILMLTFAIELSMIAENTANKALFFAEDMNDAMDCAIRGIDISLCSPDLMDTNFIPESENMITGLSIMQDQYNTINTTAIREEISSILENQTMQDDEKEEKIISLLELL